MTENISIRQASFSDLDALVELENKAFVADRFTEDQIEYLVTEAHATILIVEYDGKVGGAAYMLWRRKLDVGRLYNIAVDPALHGRGLGARLLAECEREAATRGCRVMSLEVRIDNSQAVEFYRRHGFEVTRKLPGYYEDVDGLRMVRPIVARLPDHVRLKIPYYGQTLGFTCGPAALMMALKYFHPELRLNRTLELVLWKEATLVFMTSGHGGTGPFGMAVAARRRGHEVRVIMSKNQTPFFSSVRKQDKRKVIRLMHEDMLDRAEELGVAVAYFDFPFREIASAVHRGMIPIVLISTSRLSGDRAPHWVAVTGFDTDAVYFHDSDVESYEDNPSRARDLRIPIAEFERMRRYGKDIYKSVIFVGPQNTDPKVRLDGRDL